MSNDKILSVINNSLEKISYDISNSVINLSSQGYVVNNIKYFKLNIVNSLIDILKHKSLYTDEEKEKIVLLFNKLSTL